MKRFLAFLTLALFAGSLSGYKFIDPPRKWLEDELPIRYYIGDEAPPGINLTEAVDITVDSFENWEAVECSPLETEYAGEINNEPSFGQDSRTQVTFNGSLESGVLAATVTHANFSQVLEYNGSTFSKITAMNVIFNTGPTWGTPEDIAAPNCFGLYSFMGVSTHEIGHGLGLGHSCDDGEACVDPILRAATMYWSGSRCDDAQDIPNEDDTAGINAIYGVAVDFDVDSLEDDNTIGAAPMTIVVSVPEVYQTDRFTGFEWNFGDGSPRVEMDNPDPQLDGLEHTYEEEGQYTITLTAFGEDAECGGSFETDRRKVGAVLACSPPQPAAEFVNEGDFTVQMVNTSPLGAFGCTTEYEWILDGDEASVLRTYEPAYIFDDAETHTVTLRASGPGGEGSVDIEIESTRAADGGCSASLAGRSVSSLLALLGLSLLGLLGARRRLQS